jgi:collagenase-like PrtC family protease
VTLPTTAPAADAVSSAPALDAPVRSLDMLDMQVSAGATEIYLGLPSDLLHVLTFNSLPRTRGEHPTQVSSPELMAEIVDQAHRQGLRVHFCADVQFLPAALQAAYVEHVRGAVGMGVDSVVVAGIGLMRLLRSAGVEVPLVASGYMAVATVPFARYLRDAFGVGRVIVPHSMKLGEIRAICEVPGLEVEVPVHTGAGMTCGRCMMADSPVQPEIGLGCRAGYQVRTPDGEVLKESHFLDGAADCGLRNVGDLIRIGVRALQIPGRESPNIRVNAKITQLYRKAIDDARADVPIDRTIYQIDQVELLWQMRWVPRYCDMGRCRFLETPITKAYV